MTIFGATKELVEYHVLDDSLFLRPRIVIKNAEKLLSIPDEEFAKWTTVQRSNLVMESAGTIDPAFRFPVLGPRPIPPKVGVSSAPAPSPTQAAQPLPGLMAPRRLDNATQEIRRLPPVPLGGGKEAQPAKREQPREQ